MKMNKKKDFNTTGSTPYEVNGKEISMFTRIQFKTIGKLTGLLLVLLAALALASCASSAQAAGPSCFIDMGKRVNIDVTDVKPSVLFDRLASQAGCPIKVSPLVWKHVTLKMQKATITQVLAVACPRIGCKYIYNGGRLSIQPLTIIDSLRARQWEQFNKSMEERNRILQSRLPKGMSFEAAPLSDVLKKISKASGLEIKPWKDEGDRKVTLDVSGMTVNEAIKAVLLYVDGEGAVLIRQKYFLHQSWGQHWPWGYPPTR
jgi:hypothetical protein